jgi:diguanylate cyclase (GGDEF)-like protein
VRTRKLRERTAELDRLVKERTEQLSEAHAHLQALASLDGLTGVANRRSLDQALEREWGRLGQSGQPLAMILVDVDHFKAFNDRYGHGNGDDCLRRVASALQAGCRRAGDLVARYGGEEFVVVLPDTHLDGAMSLALRLRGNVEGLHIEHDTSPTAPIVTVSLGVASAVPIPGSRVTALLEAADAALYRAKESGRNIVISAAAHPD